MIYKNSEMLKEPLKMNVWRAPLANERTNGIPEMLVLIVGKRDMASKSQRNIIQQGLINSIIIQSLWTLS